MLPKYIAVNKDQIRNGHIIVITTGYKIIKSGATLSKDTIATEYNHECEEWNNNSVKKT